MVLFGMGGGLLAKLAREPLDFECISALRNRLIIVWRLCQLYRSIDLARTVRTLSFCNGKCYVLTKRKNAKNYSWETVIDNHLPKGVNPRQLLTSYVEKTAHYGKKGGPLLLGLVKPYVPLSSNTIGSLTRGILHKHGIPIQEFGPHSTRGAGVAMYKNLGLSSEAVCEVGKWKNMGAFQAHYLRLNAADAAGGGTGLDSAQCLT